jgi:hypothetical protein
MNNPAPTKKKLKLNLETVTKLSPDELEDAVGGVSGIESNRTSGDWSGVKLASEWYLQKYTLRCGK